MRNIDVVGEFTKNAALPYLTMGIREGLAQCGKFFTEVEIKPMPTSVPDIESSVNNTLERARACAQEKNDLGFPVLYMSSYSITVPHTTGHMEVGFFMSLILHHRRLTGHRFDPVIELPSSIRSSVDLGCAHVHKFWPGNEAIDGKERLESDAILASLITSVRASVQLIDTNVGREKNYN